MKKLFSLLLVLVLALSLCSCGAKEPANDDAPEDKVITVGIRPVHLDLAEDGFDARIDVSEMMGPEMHLHMNIEGQDIIGIVPTAGLDLSTVKNGSQIFFSFDPALIHMFDPETELNLI